MASFPNAQSNPSGATPCYEVYNTPYGSTITTGVPGGPPIPMTAGQTYAAGRAAHFNCTGSGTVNLITVSGVTVVWILQTGTSILPYAITEWTAGTATGVTAWNLP